VSLPLAKSVALPGLVYAGVYGSAAHDPARWRRQGGIATRHPPAAGRAVDMFGPIGKIDDWLRWPRTLFFFKAARIGGSPGLRNRGEDGTVMTPCSSDFFAFASDDGGLSILEGRGLERACRSIRSRLQARVVPKSTPEYLGIFAPYGGFEDAASPQFGAISFRHAAQLAKESMRSPCRRRVGIKRKCAMSASNPGGRL